MSPNIESEVCALYPGPKDEWYGVGPAYLFITSNEARGRALHTKLREFTGQIACSQGNREFFTQKADLKRSAFFGHDEN